jgi:transmembrane sensor
MRKNQQIFEEASEWLVELRTGEPDAAMRERLDAWFRASPEHIRAYLELSSIWEDCGDSDLDRSHSTDELIVLARAAANVVPLERTARIEARRIGTSRTEAASLAQTPAVGAASMTRSTRISAPESSTRRAPPRLLLMASIATAAGVAGLLGLWFLSGAESSYATRTGEERSIKLSDGSSLQLNSRSRIRVRFSEQEREVDLLEGQALFTVAKDAARPFVVHSDAARVRAVGTQFDVYRKASATTVTVVEGRVAVLPFQAGAAEKGSSAVQQPHAAAVPYALDDGSPDTIFLAAGEQVTIAPSMATKPAKADVATATAWTQHQLVFASASLLDVAQEFNRYNVRQLVVNDAGLKDFHVTGVFASTDPASLLRFLRAQRGINVEELDREIRISKR